MMWGINLNKTGIDSKRFERAGFRGKFVACFGGAVTTNDYNRFKEFYSDTLDTSLTRYGYTRDKKAYKSYDFRHLFDKGDEIISELAKTFLSSDLVTNVDIFFTYFSIKHPFMYLFFLDPFTERMSTQDFLKDVLSQYYSLVCAWKKNEMEEGSVDLLCDAIQGRTPQAWEEMRDKDNFKIVYAGDNCEPLISAVDIILKAIDLFMENNGLQFRAEFINGALDALGCSRPRKVTFIGEIPKILPFTRKSINFTQRLLHPIVYLMPEGLPKLIVEGKEVTESDVIRGSPLFTGACDLAWQENGSVKIFDYGEDRKAISNDILIPTGKKSKLYADQLQKLGYKIKEIKDLSKK